MRARILHRPATKALLALALISCTQEQSFTPDDEVNLVTSPGDIGGRVCDPSGQTWLQDAQVYTHVKSADVIIDTRVVYTDRDGFFLLEDLPSETDYDIFIQYGADRLVEQEKYGVYLSDGARVDLDEPDCFDPLQIDVAIVSGSYDSFELVLTNMGFANYVEVDGLDLGELQDFLTDLDTMKSFDIIFFNGGHIEEEVFYPTQVEDDGEDEPGLGDGGSDEDTGAPPISDTIMQNIRDYVYEGGSIYASDWSYDVIERGWPTIVDFVGDDEIPDAAQLGEYDLVNAAISDGDMAKWMDQDYIEIEYDLPVWAPVYAATDSVSTHLSGNVAYRQGQATYDLPNSPLLISFSSGEGKVVYSTFRVSRNATSDVLEVLQFMMYNNL